MKMIPSIPQASQHQNHSHTSSSTWGAELLSLIAMIPMLRNAEIVAQYQD
jgi:hypothetical protein